jgi:hypothetical protein
METVTVSEVASEIILWWTQRGAKMRHLLWYALTPDDQEFATKTLRLNRSNCATYRADLVRVELEVRRLAKWAIETEEAS